MQSLKQWNTLIIECSFGTVEEVGIGLWLIYIYIYIFFFDLKYFQNFIELKKIIVHHLEQFVQENRDSLLTKQRSYQCLEHIYLRGEPIYWLADEHGRISLDENYENQTRNHTPQQRLKKVGERSFTKHLWESMSHSPKQILVTNIY